jgi:hypothetical protein
MAKLRRIHVERQIFACLVRIATVASLSICQAGFGETPEALPATAKTVSELKLPNLEFLRDKNLLYIVVPDDQPLPATIQLPRLANVVKSIRWISEDKATMQIKPEPTQWSIDLSQPPETDGRTIVMELDCPVELFHENVAARPDKDSGIILLPAKFAATHGNKLRFEPQPHKNTVGYWSDEHDTASWSFQCYEPGAYEIDILQGCGKGHGGSTVTLSIADQSIDFVVEETGHFQNFIWRTLGSVSLKNCSPNETSSLRLTPQTRPGGAVMDVRAIRLCPVGSIRSFEPELADPLLLPTRIKN